MNHLKTLVMMQLKDKIDLSFLKTKKSLITKIIFTILAFLAVTVVCYLLFTFCGLLKLFSQLPMVPVSVVLVVFIVMISLSIISCGVGLTKTLYMAKDNQVLLTLPVKPNMIFMSKLIVYYIYELMKNCYFLLPLFVAYGFINGFSLIFYPWLIVCFLLVSACVVLLGALLSMPIMFISNWLKRLPALRMGLFVALIALIIYIVVQAIAIIPENINLINSWTSIFWRIQDFLNWVSVNMFPFNWIIELICGTNEHLQWTLFSWNTLFIFAGLLVSSAILFAICFFVSRPIYFKMASRPFEYKKKIILKRFANAKKSKFISSVSKEIKTSIRTPSFIYNYGSVLIVLPISIFLLNKIFSALNTALFGVYLTFSFNILLILLVVLASNSLIASIYSSDGRSAYAMKTTPLKYSTFLFPKLVVAMTLTVVSIIITMIIFDYFAKIGIGNIILLIIGVIGLYVGHLFWSAELDLMNPQNEQYATTGGEVNNPNERKSTIFAFLISGIYFGLSLFFFTESIQGAWIKLCLIGVVFAIVRIYFYFSRIKYYYGEV